MNAISLLRKEHTKVRAIFSKISKKNHQYATRKKQLANLCQDLIRHEMMEHRVWYPAFKNNKKIKSEVRHLLSEEKHAEKAIKQFKKIKSKEEWEIKFSKFKKAVKHHAREEETKLFPNVKKILTKAELEKIGKKMRKFNQTYRTKK